MNLTANQLYKQSNSSLTFKEWLKNNQQKGLLDNHEKMYNMIDGEEDEEEQSTTTTTKPTTQRAVTKMNMLNIVALVGIGFLIYGLSKSSE